MIKAAPLEDALAKKGGLTLGQLVDYDDRLTDALVDRVYYWTTIRKLRPGFHASRGIREEDVCRILQNHIVLQKDPATAVQKLLELSALKNYLHSLKTKDEKEHFQRHLLKYVRIYMPDCPFEVCTTNRYTVTTHEAAVMARKEIKKGDVIKYLTGIQVAMTKKEEQELDLKNRDFSIVMSSRKKTPSLFLGPARFANHDCNANARLSTTGAHGMQIVSVRNIEIGEEITVTYGDDYFGEDNRECLCSTCEIYRRNGWSRKKKRRREETEEVTLDIPGSPLPERTATPDCYSLRRKRKYMFDADTHSPIPTSSASTSPAPTKKSKRLSQQPKSAKSSVPTRLDTAAATLPTTSVKGVHPPWPAPRTKKPAITYSKLHRHRELLSTSSPDDRSLSPASSFLDTSQASNASTDATSVSDTTDTIKPEPTSDAESDLTTLSSNCEFDDTKQRVIRKRKRGLPPTRHSLRNKPSLPSLLPSIEPGASSATSSDSDSSSSSDDDDGDDDDDDDDTSRVARPPRRKPADYTLTPLLLPTLYSRWVECRNCDDVFVQHDVCETRATCPRCERHSKLYGYAWPKCDKDGRYDDEERVLDHRLVHRFVSRKDEQEERKERAGSNLVALLKKGQRRRRSAGSRASSAMS